MYFPSNMNFQYFFFDTYPGYFLQVLPIALLAGLIYAAYQFRRKKPTNIGKVVPASLFICYVTGLLCLTLFEKIIGAVYYYLFYHQSSGRTFYWFTFAYNFIPDFFLHFNTENVGNILLYLPFGVLYPIFRKNCSWKRTILVGIAISVAIELLQPMFGRSFDINDIILNGIGIIISAAFFYFLKSVLRRKH